MSIYPDWLYQVSGAGGEFINTPTEINFRLVDRITEFFPDPVLRTFDYVVPYTFQYRIIETTFEVDIL